MRLSVVVCVCVRTRKKNEREKEEKRESERGGGRRMGFKLNADSYFKYKHYIIIIYIIMFHTYIHR